MRAKHQKEILVCCWMYLDPTKEKENTVETANLFFKPSSIWKEAPTLTGNIGQSKQNAIQLSAFQSPTKHHHPEEAP